jgi:hypothetical protein
MEKKPKVFFLFIRVDYLKKFDVINELSGAEKGPDSAQQSRKLGGVQTSAVEIKLRLEK